MSLLLIDIRNKLLSSFGITFILIGTVGNVLNIILFKKRTLWKLSPCIPFLLAASITNIIEIYSAVLLRMLIGFKITPVFYSSFACKLQVYLHYTSISLSNWFIVACCVDRFLSSSPHVNVRRYSSMRMTARIILISTIIISLVHSQVLYCYEANQFNKSAPCYPQNTVCEVFDLIYYFILQSIVPPVLMFGFGIGTFTHIRQGRQVQQESTNGTVVQTGTILPTTVTTGNTRNTRKNGREILPMLTAQFALYIICSTPFLVMKVYLNIPLSTIKNDMQISIENLVINISVLFSFVDKVFSFCIYTLSSKYYRAELIKLFTPYWLRRRIAPQN